MQDYQIESEEAALELIENLTEQAWAEIEGKIMCALKTLIEGLLEDGPSQRLNADSANRIFYGVTDLMNENWRGSHLKEIQQDC